MMDRWKWKLVGPVMIIAVAFGGLSALAQNAKKTIDKKNPQLIKQASHKERQKAAARAKPLNAKKVVSKIAKTRVGVVNPLGRSSLAAVPTLGGAPDYFGSDPNWALSPLPRGSIDPASVVIESGGTGYISPIVQIVDAYNTSFSATATATVTAGVITAITITNPGSGYTAPMVSITEAGNPNAGGAAATVALNPATLTGGIRKFVNSLPGLGAAGANNNIQADGRGQYIPVAVPNTTAYAGADYYEIELGEYTEKMHVDLPPTRLRGYRQTNTTDATVSRFHYLGPLIIATKDRPVRVKFTNSLPGGVSGNLFIPVDTTNMGAGKGPCGAAAANYPQNRATIHLHGGTTPWISDGTTHQWITPASEATPYPHGVSVYNVPDMGPGTAANVPGGWPVPPQSFPGNCQATSGKPGQGSQTFFYTNQQSARLMFYHDHAAGLTRLNVYAGEAAGYLLTDDVEQALINGGTVKGRTYAAGTIPGIGIPLVIQDKSFVDPATIPYQDPTWNNSYAGGSLWWPHVYMPNQNPNDLSGMNGMGRWHYGPYFWPPINPTYGPVQNPYYDPTCNPFVQGACEPPTMPGIAAPNTMAGATPYVSVAPEAFLDTPLVNGTAYPYLEVDPKAYRFRVLNAANDRFWNLQLWVAADKKTWVPAGDPNAALTAICSTPAAVPAADCTEVKMIPFNSSTRPLVPAAWGTTDDRAEGVPEPVNIGPPWIQIGTEGGFLPAPALVNTQPINYVWDKAWATFGNVKEHSLFLGPAERADVIVDFSAYAGKTLILYNDSPAPVPAGDPRLDWFTGKADQSIAGDGTGGSPTTFPGYGPNTRTIMQIRVRALTPAPAFNLAQLQAAFASNAQGPGVFAANQEEIIVPQSTYNSAYNATFPDVLGGNYAIIPSTSLTFDPLGPTALSTFPLLPKAVIEEMERDYGRMNAILGVEIPNANFQNQTSVLQSYNDPPTEVIKVSDPAVAPIGAAADGTQLWRITHNGVDTHALHFHMFHVQIVNRIRWDNGIEPPEPNERGWKDTIRVNPLSDTVLALRPIMPKVPWDVPNSLRPLAPALPIGSTDSFWNTDPLGNPVTITNHISNFGWEYVWHCHLLGHEENDMMRAMVVAVPPKAPTNLTLTVNGTSAVLNWASTGVNVTDYIVQRATNDTFTAGLVSLNPVTTNAYTDTLPAPGTYYYRVYARNTVGSTVPGYPTQTANSLFSNTATNAAPSGPPSAPTNVVAALAQGPTRIVVTWNDVATNETSYEIQRALGNGAFATLPALPPLPAGSTTTTDTTVALGSSYRYRVRAVNGTGPSAWVNSNSVTVTGPPPEAPTNFAATTTALTSGARVDFTWSYPTGTNITGFSIQGATNATFTAGVFNRTVTDPAARAYSISPLARRANYYFRIRANAPGNTFSNWVNVTPFPVRTPN